MAIQKPITFNEDLDIDKGSDTDSSVSDSGQNSPQANILSQRRMFEFNFTVDKLQGSLYKSALSEDSPDQLLVDLIAEKFQFQFYQRLYDINAELSLEALFVEDNIEKDPLPEFRNIVSSKDLADPSSESKLFQLRFIKVNPDMPDFESSYKCIDTNLEVSLSTINLVVTRKTILTLLDFILVTFSSVDKSTKEKTNKDEIARDANDITHQQARQQVDNENKIRIRANLSAISVILNNDGIRLATATLRTANVELFIQGKALKLGARLGNLSLLDDVNQGVPSDSPLRQLISIEGDELADLKYETYDEKSQDYPGFYLPNISQIGFPESQFLIRAFQKNNGFFCQVRKDASCVQRSATGCSPTSKSDARECV